MFISKLGCKERKENNSLTSKCRFKPLQKKLGQKLGKLGFLGFSTLSKLVELNQQA